MKDCQGQGGCTPKAVGPEPGTWHLAEGAVLLESGGWHKEHGLLSQAPAPEPVQWPLTGPCPGFALALPEAMQVMGYEPRDV